jgi:transposase
LTLAYLDECGFSPSQPVNYSWMLPGQRTLVPYEYPQGRRVNAIGVLLFAGDQRALWWDTVARTLTAHDVLTIIEAIPRGPGELVVVLDNASIHHNQTLAAAAPRLQEQGIHLYYLPRYSSELNRIEPYFGVIKHTELPERTYPTVEALQEAIDRAFTRCEQRLLAKMQQELRPAA